MAEGVRQICGFISKSEAETTVKNRASAVSELQLDANLNRPPHVCLCVCLSVSVSLCE